MKHEATPVSKREQLELDRIEAWLLADETGDRLETLARSLTRKRKPKRSWAGLIVWAVFYRGFRPPPGR